MKFLPELAAGIAASVLLQNIADADQISDFSVFRPAAGVTANIYIDNRSIMVHTSKVKARQLIQIKQTYIERYPNQLYRITDKNADGLIELSALYSVNQQNNQFCYSVFNFNPATGAYSSAPSTIECRPGPSLIARK